MTVPSMPFANGRLAVTGCIVTPNIAPLGVTMRLFTANLRKQLIATVWAGPGTRAAPRELPGAVRYLFPWRWYFVLHRASLFSCL